MVNEMTVAGADSHTSMTEVSASNLLDQYVQDCDLEAQEFHVRRTIGMSAEGASSVEQIMT